MVLSAKKWLGSEGTSQRVIRDFAGLLLERGGRFALGFVVTGIVARHLGPNSFGELSYGLAIGMIGAGIAQLGLDSLVMRNIARNPDEAAQTFITALVLRTAASLIVWCGLMGAATILSANHESAVVLIVLGLTALSAVTSIPALWFQAKTLGRWPAWAGFGVFILSAIIRLLLVNANVGLLGFAWVAVAEMLATGALTAWMVRLNSNVASRWRFSTEMAKHLGREAWPLWVSGLATSIYMRADQIILNALSGKEQVGLLAAALRLSEQGYIVPMVLAPPMLGALAARTTASGERERLVERYFSASVLVAYGFCICVWIVSPWVYGNLFGHAFVEASSVARVQVLGAPFVFLGVARSQALVVAGLVRFSMWTTLAGATVNVIANLLFAARFGAIGAAWSGVASQIVAAWLSTWCHPATRSLARAQTGALLSPWRAFNRIPAPLA
jgi:O-antigen/teichoic acid export membrane protein